MSNEAKEVSRVPAHGGDRMCAARMPPFPVPGVMKGWVRKQVTAQIVRCADSVE